MIPASEGPRSDRVAAVQVRRATAADLEPMLDLMELVAGEGRWLATEVPFDRDARRARWVAGLADDRSALYVAVSDGRVVGHLRLDWPDRQPVHFGMLVAPELRGRGVVTALLRASIEWARSAGAHKIALEVWPDNVAAIGLYEKLGFEREGYLRKHYRRNNGELWDTVVMGLLL